MKRISFKRYVVAIAATVITGCGGADNREPIPNPQAVETIRAAFKSSEGSTSFGTAESGRISNMFAAATSRSIG